MPLRQPWGRGEWHGRLPLRLSSAGIVAVREQAGCARLDTRSGWRCRRVAVNSGRSALTWRIAGPAHTRRQARHYPARSYTPAFGRCYAAEGQSARMPRDRSSRQRISRCRPQCPAFADVGRTPAEEHILLRVFFDPPGTFPFPHSMRHLTSAIHSAVRRQSQRHGRQWARGTGWAHRKHSSAQVRTLLRFWFLHLAQQCWLPSQVAGAP